MEEERLIHDWLVRTLKSRLSREYKDIKDNLEGKKNEFKGHYPDLILGNHGMILAIVEVETVHSINKEKVSQWKAISESGTKLILMLPKKAVKSVTELLWEASIADRVSIGTYDIVISMP
ncbi:hypothetical protein MNBD_NITROSPIRAE02-663 [hydrothermal vent metagenome]|uniref:Uncharacterized protein n=1 Tax=hydrothermal vent metagenome TaxID=652676 RepID=A0A3B1CKD1_9ZZZZ